MDWEFPVERSVLSTDGAGCVDKSVLMRAASSAPPQGLGLSFFWGIVIRNEMEPFT